MTREEFTAIMLFLVASVGKEMTEPTINVYFDLLGDLPYNSLLAAVKLTLLENTYPTIPTVGKLREAAVRVMQGNAPTAIEAWGMAIAAVGRFGLSGKRKALECLPTPVARAVEYFGWRSLCDSTEPEISRAQFVKAYDALATREHRTALMPPAVRELLESVGRDARPEEVDYRALAHAIIRVVPDNH